MSYVDSMGIALRESRFATDVDVVRALLPGIDTAAPPLSLIEYVDGIPRSALGWPFRPSEGLRRELFRFVVTAIGRALNESDTRDLDDLTLEGVREEPYFAELSTLLARCLAHGPDLRLDAVLWLYISEVVARLLTRDEALLRRYGTVFPDDVAKATQYLDELLRLKGSSPSRHAAVKGRALRALLARHDLALSSSGEANDSGLHRLLVENRLAWTEQPDGLYSFFDLREAFLTRNRGFDLDSFLGLQKLLRATVDDAWRKRAAGSTSLAERWMLEQFITEPLLERASRLNLAGLADTKEEDYPARVAVVASLQPNLARYLLHHSEQFPLSRAAAKRYEIGKDLSKRLKDASAIAAQASQYVDVVEDVLRWDILNTLRGFLHQVEAGDGDLWQEGSRRLRSSTRVIDMAHPATLHSRRRHGTVVAWKLVGFSDELRTRTQAESGELASGEDFEALCLRRILAAREHVSAGGGRADGFERGVGLDVFPRALDALRYANVLQSAIESEQEVQLGLTSEASPNPFARAVRLGMAAGAYIDVQIPSATGLPHVSAVGVGPDAAVALVDQPEETPFGGRVVVDEYDPLDVFHATVTGGKLVNHGFVSNERAFREVLASVRLDGMTHSAQDRRAVIAGRHVEFKNYEFELVFDDPVLRKVVLVRRIAEPSDLLGERAPLFEYVTMTVEEFVSFHDRAAETAKHQPKVRRPSTPRELPLEPALEPTPVAAAPIPDLAVPDAAAFMVGSERSASQDMIGGKLGLSFEDKPAVDESQGFLSGLLGEDGAGAWPQEGGWLSGPAEDEGSPVEDAAPALAQDFTSLVESPSAPQSAEDPLSFADSRFDDFSLGDPRPVMQPDPAESPSDLFGFESGMMGDFFAESQPEQELEPAPVPAPPTAQSLLGRLEPDFLDLLAAVEPDAVPHRAPTKAPLRKRPLAPKPETVKAVRPDFSSLFRDYVIFDIGAPGAPDAEIAIGRRYKDVLFDLHRFPPPPGAKWGHEQAVDEFMRLKVRDNFVPRSLSYDEVPPGAGPLESLSIENLVSAFDRVT